MSATNPFNFLGGLILEIGAVIAVVALLLPFNNVDPGTTFNQPTPTRNAVYYGSQHPPLSNYAAFRPSLIEREPAFRSEPLDVEQRFAPSPPHQNTWVNDRLLPPAPANYVPRTAEAQPRIRSEFNSSAPSYRTADARAEGYYDRY